MTKEAKKSVSINLDEILDEVGHFGTYQLYACGAVMLTTVFYATCCAQFVFNTLKTPYRCVVPECESPPYKFVPTEVWADWALPPGHIEEQCERKAPKGKSCTPDNFSDRTIPCTAWVYENNNTIRSEFNMACRDYMSTTVGTVHNAGVFTTLFLTAIISDTYGRKVAYLMTAVSASVMGLIRSFSISYLMYLIFEYLEAALGAGVYSSGFVLAMEMVGPTRRVFVATIIACAFSVGQAMVAAFAHFVRQWQTFTRCIYTPGLFFLLYYFLVEESVRWLLSKGKNTEALRIMYRVARINKKQLSTRTIEILTTKVHNENENNPSSSKDKSDKETKGPSLFHRVIRSKQIVFRVSVAVFWWMAQTFVFYGIKYISVDLGANRYVSYAVVGIAEIPGYFLCLLCLDRYGRKKTFGLSFLGAGLFIYTVPFIPVSARVMVSFISKALVSSAASANYIYTMELFPTEARQSLHNFCSMIGRLGSMTAPQAVLLTKLWKPLPFIVFGTASVIAGCLVSLTPETLNTILPDTIAEAEAISDKKTFKPNTQDNNKDVESDNKDEDTDNKDIDSDKKDVEGNKKE